MVCLTLVFFAVARMGLVFLAGALDPGRAVPAPGVRDVARRHGRARGRLYKYSITYLTALFALMILDVFVFVPL